MEEAGSYDIYLKIYSLGYDLWFIENSRYNLSLQINNTKNEINTYRFLYLPPDQYKIECPMLGAGSMWY